MTYTICGQVFTKYGTGNFLCIDKCFYKAGNFFNKLLGFINARERNKFISRELDIRIMPNSKSPEFYSQEDLEVFILYVKNRFERKVIKSSKFKT